MSEFKIHYEGEVRDFGHYWAFVDRVSTTNFLGVSLHSEGHGVMSHKECMELGRWLVGVSAWLSRYPQPPPTSRITIGPCVYAVGDSCGNYKVGKANNVRDRLKSLQTGNAKKLNLIAWLSVSDDSLAFEVESYCHRLLDEFRSTGEWFSCDEVQAVTAIRNAALHFEECGDLVVRQEGEDGI
jgi:hypothetical protein